MTRGCSACGVDAVAEEQVVEHDCGLMDCRSVFTDGCPKCDRSTAAETFNAVETVARCSECGQWHAPVADAAEGGAGPTEVTFPDLPELGRSLTWLPLRLAPDSERRRQLLSSVLAVLVVTGGLTGTLLASPLLEPVASTGTAVEPTWEEYDSIVIFRNDDVQPWYETERMRAVDRVFIETGVPVTLGVIPNPGGDLPLASDTATCRYLGSLQDDHPGQFEMALHGYTHRSETDFHGASEFGGLAAEEQSARLAAGERLLGECVEPSSTFVPPMNTYDEATVRALDDRGYTAVSGGTWFTDAYYDRNGGSDAPAYFEAGGLTHVPEIRAFENWDAYDGNEEVPLEETETLTAAFDETHADGGVYVQMLHYQYFTTEERLDRLRALIAHMKAAGDVGFMTVGQFAAGLENGTIERTDDGWRVLEPIEYTSSEVASVNQSVAVSEAGRR